MADTGIPQDTTAQRINQMFELGFGPIVRAAFRAAGLPVEWGMAIAKIESGFDPRRKKLTGSDGARGGAWGICQMTLQTAREELGYKGDGVALLEPELCATLAAKLCVQNIQKFGSREFKDVAAEYNGGRPYAKSNKMAKAYSDTACQYANKYTGKFVDESDATVA